MEIDKIPQETPIVQTPIENEPVHKSLLNQKGSILLILGVIVIIVVLGAGGYFLTKNKNSNSNQDASQTIPTSTQPAPLNETENWKIYQNAIFSFKYPDTVTPHDINDQYTDVSMNFKYPGSPDGCELCDGYLLEFKSGKLNNQSLKEAAEKTLKEKEAYGSITQPLKSLNINRYSGLTFSYTVQVATTEIYLSDEKGNYIEIRESIDDPQKRGYGKTIDQILSTFNFTDQNSLNLSKTSPDASYAVSETMLGDYNTIVVKDSSGKVITDDLIKKNEKAIGYGTKFGCQCGTSFGGWTNGSHFLLKIVNGNGEEYQYTVDASTGIVNEASFKRIK